MSDPKIRPLSGRRAAFCSFFACPQRASANSAVLLFAEIRALSVSLCLFKNAFAVVRKRSRVGAQRSSGGLVKNCGRNWSVRVEFFGVNLVWMF